MSCSLRSLPSLPDLCHLKTLLFPEGPVPGESVRDDDYDNRWSWDESEGQSEAGRDVKKDSNSDCVSWLDKCINAISPDGSVFVIAHGQRILSLCIRQSSWHVSCCKTLDGFSHFEKITSVALIPLISQLKSNDGGIDWTALLIGSTHGILRVFTSENGCPLIIQKFCEDPLNEMKCSSFYPHSLTGQKRHVEQSDQLDDILLVFNNNMIAVIEGFAFYQTIRSTRNHLAKLRVDENAVKYVLDMKISLPANKWILDSPAPVVVGSPSNVINDVSSGGESVSTMFDQMVTASFHGPSTRPKNTSASATQFITTGETPFIGFYRTIQAEQPSLLNNVAQAVVSRAKNLLPLFSSSKSDDNKVNDTPPVRILEHLGLYDQHREGLSILFSRDKSLAVVTDDFGRVSLLDTLNWLVIRKWKGYRDAQCSFLIIPEDVKSLSCKKSQCLVIYAPKRGLLEIWRLQLGSRLASFNIGKKCKLFTASHSSFGVNHRSYERDGFMNEYQTFLFDSLTGKLFVVDVPYVCTLTDENSRMVRDGHFVKEFKQTLNVRDQTRQLIPMKQIQSKAAKSEMINLSLESGPDEAEFVAKSFINIVLKDVEDAETELDIENKLFLQSCYRVLQLIRLYRFLSSKQDLTLSFRDVHRNHPTDIENQASLMGWSAVDVAKCLSLFSLRHSVLSPKETPSVRTLLSFQDFISFFAVETTQVIKSGENDSLFMENIPIDVKWKLDSSHGTHELLAKFMFEVILDENSEETSKELFQSLDESCVTPKSLLQLIFLSWLSMPFVFEDWNNWSKFSFAVRTIGLQLTETPGDDQSLPVSWQIVCCRIISSKNIPAALIATFIVKAVTEDQLSVSKIKSSKKKKTPDDSKDLEDEDEDDEWETLHVDKEKLNIVTKQMEDVFLLDLLLHSDSRFSFESQSLAQLIKSDSGIVSELVSRWAVALDLDIVTCFKDLNNDDQVEEAKEVPSTPEPVVEETVDALQVDTLSKETTGTIDELLLHVRRCFPHSLNQDVILVNCCWECISLWMKHSDEADIQNLLSKSLSLVNNLSSSLLKHNLSCLVWKTFLEKQLDILSALTEKMGKIPKDRILRKELSMGEDCLESFINFSYSFLEIILENIQESDMKTSTLSLPVFKTDDWWANDRNHRDRRPPLISLASCSVIKTSNPAIVLCHLHLMQVLVFMVTFQLKNVKPLFIFNSITRQILFGDFHVKFVQSKDSDRMVDENRISFLEKVIASIAQSIPSEANEDVKSDLLLTPSRMYSQANKWFGTVLTLGREWDLDTDILRRRYVCELYANRCDSLGEELRNSCRDTTSLATQLLPIVCQRVLMDGSKSLLSLPPPVLKWMQSLECCFRVTQSSSSSTRMLMEFVRIHLPDDSVSLSNISVLMDHFD